jgi:RNA polymerase-interacting CarD/CdnL/TRCF family regulator
LYPKVNCGGSKGKKLSGGINAACQSGVAEADQDEQPRLSLLHRLVIKKSLLRQNLTYTEVVTMIDSHYTIGDWVVHRNYGIGQIRSVESKSISGQKVRCFKIQTVEGTYWASIKDMGNPRMRPLASQDQIQRALSEFTEESPIVETDHQAWKKRIKQVHWEGSLIDVVKIIRDLTAKHDYKKLNDYETKALKRFTDLLIGEWAAITGLKRQTVQKKFNVLLSDIKQPELEQP